MHGCATSGRGGPSRNQESGLLFSVGFTLLASGCSVLSLPVFHREFRENSYEPWALDKFHIPVVAVQRASGIVCASYGLLHQRGPGPRLAVLAVPLLMCHLSLCPSAASSSSLLILRGTEHQLPAGHFLISGNPSLNTY